MNMYEPFGVSASLKKVQENPNPLTHSELLLGMLKC